ncbi:MAG TPA: Uma2 family endonuclease [Pyrinomonadaceae bacterium]|jgi:Uma2 family endonuclease|nr:Uma2 family endonuclease [Pyrinomonadaceae bacterium]
MTATLTPAEQSAANLVLHFAPLLKYFSEQDFFDFCMLNFRDSRIELTPAGDLIIMAPTGWKTGVRNFQMITDFGVWVKQDGTGKGSDSSTAFALPNGAKRSPDMSWVRNERWEALTKEEQDRFPPLCPDFVMELRSTSDSLRPLQEKMQEYMENGAQLGWLIDPFERKVYIYRPQAGVECLDNPASVSGEPLLRGFVLDVQSLWE